MKKILMFKLALIVSTLTLSSLVHAFPTEILYYNCNIQVDGQKVPQVTKMSLNNNKDVVFIDFQYYNAREFPFFKKLNMDATGVSFRVSRGLSGYADGYVGPATDSSKLMETQLKGTIEGSDDITMDNGKIALNSYILKLSTHLLATSYTQNYTIEGVQHTIAGKCRAEERVLLPYSFSPYGGVSQKLVCANENNLDTCNWVNEE